MKNSLIISTFEDILRSGIHKVLLKSIGKRYISNIIYVKNDIFVCHHGIFLKNEFERFQWACALYFGTQCKDMGPMWILTMKDLSRGESHGPIRTRVSLGMAHFQVLLNTDSSDYYSDLEWLSSRWWKWDYKPSEPKPEAISEPFYHSYHLGSDSSLLAISHSRRLDAILALSSPPAYTDKVCLSTCSRHLE